MSSHEITTAPVRRVPAHLRDYSDVFHRWACSCGQRGKGYHAFQGEAEQAGLDHAKAKNRA